ncbi:hypothetical protein EV186_102633 [Labedaea rhizosphaerae]|uniref:Uncharacterized protein n=1 Tax=Labedaea rhizosphaerae TaxID=598644 RepID=A0A4R6SGS2_LABRH|nr:hypothetical protein EV186_102633 [Labedaea rhizosphaerae]
MVALHRSDDGPPCPADGGPTRTGGHVVEPGIGRAVDQVEAVGGQGVAAGGPLGNAGIVVGAVVEVGRCLGFFACGPGEAAHAGQQRRGIRGRGGTGTCGGGTGGPTGRTRCHDAGPALAGGDRAGALGTRAALSRRPATAGRRAGGQRRPDVLHHRAGDPGGVAGRWCGRRDDRFGRPLAGDAQCPAGSDRRAGARAEPRPQPGDPAAVPAAVRIRRHGCRRAGRPRRWCPGAAFGGGWWSQQIQHRRIS